MSEQYVVGQLSADEIKKQLKRYEKLDAEAEEYSNALPEKFESEYDEKSGNLLMKSKVRLSPEEQKIADKAVERIARDYGEVIKKLEEE